MNVTAHVALDGNTYSVGDWIVCTAPTDWKWEVMRLTKTRVYIRTGPQCDTFYTAPRLVLRVLPNS